MNQPKAHDLFTTKLPDGSLGYGNAEGNIIKSTAVVALPGPPNADGIISDCFIWRRGIYDPGYRPPRDWTKENQGGYSAYFHYAQFNICFTGPPNGGMKRLLR